MADDRLASLTALPVPWPSFKIGVLPRVGIRYAELLLHLAPYDLGPAFPVAQVWRGALIEVFESCDIRLLYGDDEEHVWYNIGPGLILFHEERPAPGVPAAVLDPGTDSVRWVEPPHRSERENETRLAERILENHEALPVRFL